MKKKRNYFCNPTMDQSPVVMTTTPLRFWNKQQTSLYLLFFNLLFQTRNFSFTFYNKIIHAISTPVCFSLLLQVTKCAVTFTCIISQSKIVPSLSAMIFSILVWNFSSFSTHWSSCCWRMRIWSNFFVTSNCFSSIACCFCFSFSSNIRCKSWTYMTFHTSISTLRKVVLRYR